MIDYPPRTEIVKYLKSVLCGPRDSEDEEIQGTPFLRYMTGMLFPLGEDVKSGEDSVSASAEDTLTVPDSDDEGGQLSSDELGLAFEVLPSAVGLSFRVAHGATLRCSVWAASYVPMHDEVDEPNRRRRSSKKWKRMSLATEDKPVVLILKESVKVQEVFGGLAEVVSRWRPRADGSSIVTITLVNRQQASSKGLDPATTLFQVGLRCEPTDGVILPYPEVGSEHDEDSEELEVAFLYKESIPFARGHGSAANWGGINQEGCAWVSTEFIPSVDVPAATFTLKSQGVDSRCTDIQFLGNGNKADVLSALDTLPNEYKKWIDQHRNDPVEPKFGKVAKRFVQRADVWFERMKLGIDLLRSDSNAWLAFQLANRAMGMQMLLADEAKKGPFHLSDHRLCPKIDKKKRTWRPFQVAFMLATMESVWKETSGARTIVDVIWFPTGGGKTEAYLFVAAFELIRRRLIYADADTSTAIMSRYTLRMLTAQQFQRTAALIASLELLRRQMEYELGAREFSLGLWVGSTLTPNTFKQASESFTKQLDSASPKNLFQLLSCPCCATELFPAKPTGRAGYWQRSEFGITATANEFKFHCPNPLCEFHGGLPCNVVDEALYRQPPSILLGTIDKFAQLPWDNRARAFFGGVDDTSPPPTLILQDELHLISGPLGTLAAPYEAAMDTVIALRGHPPKRIASTATIRNAQEQVRGLYGREVAVFPSPCGKWDDAFFFNSDLDRPGRQYVGVMGQGYTKPVVAMAWTAAAMLQSPMEVPMSGKTLDAYWTVLAYHNSRRELGRTLTAARDEVETRIKAIASSPALARKMGEPLELSSQMNEGMSEALEKLVRQHSAARPAVDFVPCTSIISVGVDVDRLGMMMVNGQPKLTSEYIQATSRVGRAEIPGLVVTLFSPSKPRDRSHYEDFRAYHESIYRHVEPTSVTPYALPARLRTFHAALVTLVRHGLLWFRVEDAGSVDFTDPGVSAAVTQMLDLMCLADPTEKDELRALAAQRIKEWMEYAESTIPLHYENRRSGMAFFPLLYNYGLPPGSGFWGTMSSVRNVDVEASIAVR